MKLGEHRLQLLASRERASYAKARVEVHERLDGSLAVYHEGKCLAIKEAPKEAGALRARSGPRAKGQVCIGVSAGEIIPKSAGMKFPTPEYTPSKYGLGGEGCFRWRNGSGSGSWTGKGCR